MGTILSADFYFGCLGGFLLGCIVAFAMRRISESTHQEIESALDTIGIRRNEFLKLTKDVDRAWMDMQDLEVRVKLIEKFTKGE